MNIMTVFIELLLDPILIVTVLLMLVFRWGSRKVLPSPLCGAVYLRCFVDLCSNKTSR